MENSLKWNEDDRSIGFCDPDDSKAYTPIIGWNFDIVKYVSHPTDQYCAFIVMVRPLGTESIFEVIWKPDWVGNFKKVMQANRNYSHGVILRNKPFDDKLWLEMMDRYLFEHTDIPTMRPAENVGLQVRYLIERAYEHDDCLSLDDVESVFKGVTYNGLGEVKTHPIHTIIEEARPKVPFQCSKFKASGLEGYLKLFLPPLTSRCPLQRSQQSLALLGETFESFYALIEYLCGECPALMLASTEPESQKTTLSLLGLKAIGDRSNFCGSDSTTEAIDERRCYNPFPFVLDDSERSRAEHKLLVGSLNAAAKNTVSKGTQEKIAGLIITKNLKEKEKWELKVLSGRLVWLLMSPARFHFEEDMEDNYDSVAEHILAMRSSDMPRDFLARLVRWFIPPGPGKLAPYQEFHKEGSIVLKSKMPSWGPRKIKSNAHIYSTFRMIEEEVKESCDSVIEQLFVEVFKDHESFVETLVENLKKVEEVEHHMIGGIKRTVSETEDFPEEPVDINRTIVELLEKFEGKDLVYTTKFFKVIYKSSQPNLAIAHPRVQKKAGELSYSLNFKGLSLKTDCAFLTNMDADVMFGRGNTGAAFCTLIPLKDLSPEVKERILERFNMEMANDEEVGTNDQDLQTASQDFPFSQSQTQDTIKVCQVCRFASRDKLELKAHMNTHHQCNTCGQFYISKKELEHHVQNHMKIKCDICNVFVRKDALITHKFNHEKQKTFGKKVKKQNLERPVTGYVLWQREERKRIVESNPDMIFTEVSSELGRLWKLVEKETKEEFKRQAKQHNDNLKKKNMEDVIEEEVEVPSNEELLGDVPVESPAIEIIEESVETTSGDSTEVEVGAIFVETRPNVEVTDDADDLDIGNLINLTNDNHLDPDMLLNLSMQNLNDCVERDDIEEPPKKKPRSSFVERTNTCPLCEFCGGNNKQLAHHMNDKHKMTQSTFIKCKVCSKIFNNETKLSEHMMEVHGQNIEEPEAEPVEEPEAEQVEEPEPEVHHDIILVKMKKLAWPAIVQKREGDILEVKMIYDDTIRVVGSNDVETFAMDKIANTKNSRLKASFAKAAILLKK